MKIFPSMDTAKERKKFAIFHSCMLVMCPIIGALIMLFMNKRWPFNDFKGTWLIGSLFLWNAIGSCRFWMDTLDTDGFFSSRLVCAVLLIGFLFVYLYNLWRVLFKNEDGIVK